VFEEQASSRAQSRSSLSRGARLGAYEVESLLGSGGMGEVYRARDTRLGRTVAIKVLPARVAENAARRRRFETEARAISQISHPHICALYDVGEADTVPFLVMEYLDGQTLADRLTVKALSVADAVEYATQIADALDAAHRRGIVHGDLKPANIMLTRGGVRLLDFGLARISTSEAIDVAVDVQPNSITATVDGVIRGTLPYLSPELLEGGKADARSDVFAFGAVLYEMLAGRRAFAGESESAVVAAILDSQPAPLEDERHAIPPALAHVVTTCLAKDPDERWQSAGDLKRQLAWIAESAQADPHAGTGNTIGKRAWLWRSAALLFLLTSLALLSLLVFRGQSPVPGRVRFHIPPPPGTAFADLNFRLSPNGRSIAYVSSEPGTLRLWVHSLETGEARMLATYRTGALGPWSPDGRFLTFTAEGTLRRIASTGGSLQTLVDAPAAANDWSGADILLFVQNGVVKRMPASGGMATPLTALDVTRQEISHYMPRFLPDGRRFVYLRRSLAEETSGVYIGSIDARPEEQDLARLIPNAAMAVYAPGPEDPLIGHMLFNRGESLLAQRFDARALRLEGNEFPVAERVALLGNPSRAAFFSASSNGVLAYREAEVRAGTPVWVNRDGVEVGGIVQAPLPNLSQLRLSPDGTRLAAIVRGEIWVYTLDGRPPIKLTSGGDIDMPFWSPDGGEIVYARGSPMQLFSVPIEVGRTPTPVSPLGHYHPHGWSPDGRDLIAVLNSYSPTGWDILKIPWRRDVVPEPLVVTSSDDGMHGAALSPDGRWLAYTLNATGNHEIWVRPYAGSAAPVRVSANGGVDPQWSRDGSELYFLEGLKRMMVVAVTPGATFSFRPARPLFELPFPTSNVFPNQSYDVAADGRFVMVRPAPPPAAPTPITIVLNWASGLTN
jgi:serine/threonine protein kinase